MGKKTRKSETSKGIHGTTRAGHKAQGMQRLLNQIDAHRKGKRTRVTLPTSQSNMSNKLFDGSHLFDRWNKQK